MFAWIDRLYPSFVSNGDRAQHFRSLEIQYASWQNNIIKVPQGCRRTGAHLKALLFHEVSVWPVKRGEGGKPSIPSSEDVLRHMQGVCRHRRIIQCLPQTYARVVKAEYDGWPRSSCSWPNMRAQINGLSVGLKRHILSLPINYIDQQPSCAHRKCNTPSHYIPHRSQPIFQYCLVILSIGEDVIWRHAKFLPLVLPTAC